MYIYISKKERKLVREKRLRVMCALECIKETIESPFYNTRTRKQFELVDVLVKLENKTRD